MSQLTLLKYNFRIMMLNNRWLVVFPVAVSQLSVFWILITRQFTADLPSQSVELVTPLLGAFLGAHILAAEYRSRVGALLACRPVNIGRIVVLRLIVMLTLVWGLAYISLLAYTYGKEPFDMRPPILATIPSTLFLMLLAMTFATLFRHSLAGFGVAALYWALDLMPGPPIHPYMSLRSLTTFTGVLNGLEHQTFSDNWWISKVVLMVGALLLYIYHAKAVFALGSAQTTLRRQRALLAAAGLIAFYIFSGALLRVGYGYANRGKLVPSDVGWFRHQFAPYGPIPIAMVFGPDFARYLGEIGNPWRMPEGNDADVVGDTPRHRHELHEIVTKSPNSVWAPSAADALAGMEARRQTRVEDSVALYRTIIDRYPTSPYVVNALRQSARTYIAAGKTKEAETAYADLLKRSPDGVYHSEALRYLLQTAQADGRWDDAGRWATQWSTTAEPDERFEPWLALAQIRKARGDDAGAKEAAEATMKAVDQFRRALDAGAFSGTPAKNGLRSHAADLAAAAAGPLLH